MNKQAAVVALVAMLVGFGGGGVSTYSWLRSTSGGGAHGLGEGNDHHGTGHRDADEHGEDEDRHGHEEHDKHGEVVRMSPEVMEETGVEVATAGPGELELELVLPGEVVVNPDQMVHIVPRVPGIAHRVTKSVGDVVEEGELLAVIESAELAEAKARFLGAMQRLGVAQANVAANKELQAKGIVAELEFLATQRELAEAEIEQRAAEFKLFTLGLTPNDLPAIREDEGQSFSTYPLVAPFAGTLIDRHISLGEVVSPDSAVFVLADLSTVWVHLTVYQKDLARIQAGQPVEIIFGHSIPNAHGNIDYVSPIVEETTRTATARVVIENPRQVWRPGLFVHAAVRVGQARAALCVPTAALQAVEGETVVFVETAGGFRPEPVTVGRTNKTRVEITSGLSSGERYVAKGAFNLKAELMKASFAGGHSH